MFLRAAIPNTRASAFCLAALWAPVCAVQAVAEPSAQTEPGATAVWREAHGIGECDGILYANGPDYRAQFNARGIEFTPAFGSKAPRSFPTRFELIGWQRSEGSLHTGATVEPSVAGNRAAYARGTGVQEHYITQRNGLELSYIFDAKPEGSGDLLVRLAVQSELPRYGDARTLALYASGLGVLTIGAVTGIAADGERVSGSMRWVGTELELSLPGDFVERAAYPLVLDPLLGVEFEVDSDSGDFYDDVSPAVAHDATNANYLIVWSRAFSISDVDIRGQRETDAGTLAGGLIAIESGTTVSAMATDPAVGNSNMDDTYYVAWESSTGIFSTRDIKCRTVSGTGILSTNTLTVAATSGNDDDPAIGGDASLTDNEVILTWSQSGTGIRARQIGLSGGQPVVAGTELAVSNGSSTSFEDYRPAISKSGGFGNNFLIAWERYFSTAATPYYDVRYAVIDRNANLLIETSSLTATSATSETDIAVAGDGVKFAVVYQQEPAAGGNQGIYGNHISFQTNGLLGLSSALPGPQVTLVDSVFNESNPDICLTLDSLVLAYIGVSILSPNSPIELRSLDMIDLAQCGPTTFFSDSGLDYDHPVLSSAAESYLNATGDVMCVVQARASSSAAGEIWAQRFSPVVGLNTEITGSCGGGRSEVGCLLSTDGTVRTHVVEAPVGAPAYLIISPQALDMPIGGCTLWADPFNGFVFSSGTTNALGEAHLSFAINPNPGLVGLQFHMQHALQSASGTVQFGTGGPQFLLSTSILCTFE